MNCTEKRKAGIDVAKKDKQQHADKEQEKVEATAQEATEEQPCTCTEDAQKPEACEADKKQDEAQEAEKKYAELEDKYLRLAAEYTNFQKRTVREKEQIYTDAVVDTVKELLPVLDSLERAEQTVREAKDINNISEGIELIVKMARDVFAKLGVEAIESLGKEFNAQLHNAVMHVEDDTYGDNEIVEEFQKGYKCKDKVIRYSMVKVAN